jgi:hypothetical protein
MISLKNNNKYKILTPSGYQSFSGLRKVIKDSYVEILLSNNKIIKCSKEHKFIQKEKEIAAELLNIGDEIDSENSILTFVKAKKIINSQIELYDIVNVAGGNLFYVDGIVSHNCDFTTTGNTVIEIPTIEFYKAEKVKDPIEMRGIDKGYWIWEYPDYTRNYIISADVARGDSSDYSAFHVIDVESFTQVAEYQGQIGTKDYGNFLVGAATEYNNALLVVENANIGWAVLQQIIDRQYPNTFYSSADLQYVDVERQLSNKYYREEKKMVPGFTTTMKTRPLLVSRMEMYFRERSIEVRSVRLMNELSTFIWNGNKPEAMPNHHDDLVMSFGIGLWVRDTALKLRQQGIDLNKSLLSGINRTGASEAVYKPNNLEAHEAWQMNLGSNKKENLTWLL